MKNENLSSWDKLYVELIINILKKFNYSDEQILDSVKKIKFGLIQQK